MSARTALRLVFRRRFAPVWAAQVLGAFNDNLFRFTLVTLATFEGLTVFGLDRTLMVPIAATAFTAPIFLFSALTGQLADRFDRTAVMRRAKIAEIVLMALAGGAFLLESGLLLLLTLFLMGVQSTVFVPARNAAMPVLLKDHELVPGNALMSGAINVAILLGAGLGTLMARGENGPETISAILVGVAVIGWLCSLAIPATTAANPELELNWNPLTQTVRILGSAWTHNHVLRPMTGVAWFWLLSASIVTLAPLLAAETLGGDETVVLVFSALFTFGAAVGAILCGALSRGRGGLTLSLIGAIGLAATGADLAYATWTRQAGEVLMGWSEFIARRENWRVLAGLTLSAVFAGLFVVPLQAASQRRAPNEIRARLLAAGAIFSGLTASLGQFSLAFIALLMLPLPAAFLLVASGSLIAAAMLALGLARGAR